MNVDYSYWLSQMAEILQAIDGYKGSLIVGCALRLAPLMFVRPGELCQAEWADTDFDKAKWRYTVTKTDTQHIVPPTREGIAIIKELQPLTGSGYGHFVFPSARGNGRPMSDNDPLFPATLVKVGAKQQFEAVGLKGKVISKPH
ncbi:MAG: hypothetical protein NPINA01_18580 [Nitrospinaceae bacterium]|nr:MAG: hypothetical protein NPINA01_18580 [Nitrospinaceae bacterium]